MAKKTIQLVSQSIAENAKATVNGNTVKLDYNYTTGQVPDAVNFSAFRGIEGAPEFTGKQTFGGSLQKNGAFSTYNLGQREVGDGLLFDEVYAICDAILKGTVVKETQTTEVSSGTGS